jgi:TolB protein
MAITQLVLQSDVFVAPGGTPSEGQPITSGAEKDDGSNGLAWTPDGKLIYATNASGNLDLWSIAASGSNPKQLTSNAGQNYEPTVTPDGRFIVFVSDRAGARNLWRMNVDGSQPVRLTVGTAHFPSCSADSRWIVYTGADDSGTVTLWRIGIDGGPPVQLTDKWATGPAISPDSKWIVFQYWAYQAQGPPAFISLLPFEGGQITNLAALGDTALFRWTPDGTAVAYVDDEKGVSNIRTIQLDGSPPKQLTDFKSDQIFWFDWSRDGKQLALARGTQTSDVVLISDFR